VVDVGEWLHNLGLGQYETAFRENGVNAEILRHLTADDLKELGIAAVGHRRQLLVAIAKLQGDGEPLQVATPPGDHPTSIPTEEAVSHSGERRQLTVMFCDLVGSTALQQTAGQLGHPLLHPI
jgi:class 3 adenylate cyclase